MKACGALRKQKATGPRLLHCACERNITGGIAPSLARHFFSRLSKSFYATEFVVFARVPDTRVFGDERKLGDRLLSGSMPEKPKTARISNRKCACSALSSQSCCCVGVRAETLFFLKRCRRERNREKCEMKRPVDRIRLVRAPRPKVCCDE